MLGRELGVEPGRELTEMVRLALRAQPSSVPG
jgi:pheromone shutdown protein TraB